MELIESLKRARATGAPLIAITTADQPELCQRIAREVNSKTPIVVWDCIRGYWPANDEGQEAIAILNQNGPVGFDPASAFTGAIRDCYEMAFAMDCPLFEAAQYIVPAGVSDPKGIEALRQAAQGKFLSASKPGTYQMPQLKTAPTVRRVNL